MSSFNVPNEFVPQSGQAISSSQVDQNNDAIEDAINAINALIGLGSGTYNDARLVNYAQRPKYTGSAAPTGQELVEYKWLAATRGCNVGDILLSINPNSLPNDYNVVWAKMEGQQLSQSAYPAFYALCTTIGGASSGQYNPAAGADPGNFVAPDWRGTSPIQILAGGSGLTSKVPNFAAANWLGSIMGESAHTQTTAEMPAHKHQVTPNGGTDPYGTGIGGASGAGRADTTTTGGGEAFNLVQRVFVSIMWVRIR